MILEALALKNFKRYRDQPFTFKDGITAIIGSNGSGKSSVMEGIVFALYGISGSGIDPDFVVSAGAGPKERCEVRLTFSTGGERYIIFRSFRKGQTTHHDASLNFGDGRLIASGVSPVRDAVLRILRMGPSDFRTTIYAPQRDLLALLDKNPIERKRWFMRALGIERIRDGSWEIIRSEIRVLEETIATLSGRLEEIDAKRLKIQDKDELLKEEEYSGRLATLSREEEKIGSEEAAATRRLDELQQMMMKLARLKDSRANGQEILLRLTRSHELLESELFILQKDLVDFELSAEREVAYEKINDHARMFRKAREDHQNATLRLRESERRYEELQTAHSKLEGRLALVKGAEEVITHLSAIPTERERLTTDLRSLEAAQEVYNRLERELASLESEIKVIRGQGQALMREREKLKALEPALSSLKDRITALADVTSLSERCMEGERLQKECRLIEDHIKDIESDIRGLRSTAVPLSEEIKKKDTAYTALAEARSEADQIRQRSATIRSEISVGKIALNESERHLKELDLVGEESPCPTCGQPLQDRYEDARTRLLNQIGHLQSEQMAFSNELSSLDERSHRLDTVISAAERDIVSCTDAERMLAGIEARIGERTKEYERQISLHQERLLQLTTLNVSTLDPAYVKRQVGEYQSFIRERDEITFELRRMPVLESDQLALAERAEQLFSRVEEVLSLRDASGYSEEKIASVKSEISRIDPLYEEYRESLVLVREKNALQRDLQAVNEQMDQIAHKSDEIRSLISEIGFDPVAYTEAEEALRGAVENHERYLSLKGRIDRIPSVKAALSSNREEQEHEKCEIKRIDREISLHASVPEAFDTLKSAMNDLLDRKKRCNAEIRDLTGLLAGVVQTRRRIQESIGKAEHFEEERSLALSDKALLESTGTVLKQFAEHLIGSVRGRIEGEVGEILSLITDGRYEHVTIDDDFSIRVHEAGEDYPASRFSGGEQDDIAVALRIALSRHIAATHRIRDATVLIFDEIFGSQDEERRKHLIRALRKQEPYFPQILLISHIEGVQEECQTTIRVEEQPDLTSVATEVAE